MKSLIIGANGGVGQHLIRKLKARDVDFTAGVRKEEQVESLKADGIDATYIDVAKQSIDELIELFKSYDQILFSVGSGGSTGDDQTIIVDLDGAVKAIKASEHVGHQHFIMVSTYDSRREAFDASGDLKPYTIAKHYADNHLRDSGLKYTIVHPGTLENGPGTGNVDIAEHFDGGGSVPREDVASVIVDVLGNEKFQGGEFQVISGSEPIEDALNNYYQKH